MISQKSILIIALLALVSLMMITPVYAETVQGTLGATVGGSYLYSTPYYAATRTISSLNFNHSENSIGTSAYVHFDAAGHVAGYAGGAPVSLANIPFTLLDTAGTHIIARGTFGYQRSYNSVGSEIEGYQWLVFSSWENLSYISGSGPCNLGINLTAAYITSIAAGTGVYSPDLAGNMWFSGGGGATSGKHIRNVNLATFAEYTAVRPSGIGIQGTVTKTHLGIVYPSRAYIFNGTSGAVIGNNPTVNTIDLPFNLLDQPIKVGIQDALGNWYNSSILFAAVVPTVTPTPAPTIPVGYIQTRIHLWDRAGNMIHGGNIDVLDVEANVWTNSTHDADGILYVNTLPYHTINIYGSYDIFENEFLPNELLGQETGYEGGYVYFLTLFPYESYAPVGQTSLYVEVKDVNTHYFIPYSVVRIDYNGLTYAQNTANAPSAVFLVPNNTVIHVSASSTGYVSGTAVTNSSGGSSKTIIIELSRSTVTTTPTLTPGPGGTIPTTQDPAGNPGDAGYSNAKGQEIMDYLASHGMELVSVCFVVTILGLLKMVSKK